MTEQDFKTLKPWLVATDVGMLTYWAVTAAKALGVLDIPDAWLFSNYDDPTVVSWNWSFLPIDILFSVTGLLTTRLYARGHPGWRPLAVVSLGLTWCAGFMAISFWVVRLEFDLVWWAANLFLMAWPMAFAPRIWRWFESGDVSGR